MRYNPVAFELIDRAVSLVWASITGFLCENEAITLADPHNHQVGKSCAIGSGNRDSLLLFH